MVEQVETLVKYSKAIRYIQSGSGIDSHLSSEILCLYYCGLPGLRNFCLYQRSTYGTGLNEGKQGGMRDGKEELRNIAEDEFLFLRQSRTHEVRKNALVEREEGVIHLLVVLNPPQAGAKKGNAWHILPVFGIDVDDFFLKKRFQCKDFQNKGALGVHDQKPVTSI